MAGEQRQGGSAERPPYNAVCDGGDLDCGSGLLLIIRRAIAPLSPGQILEVQSREPSVSVDLPAWCRMTGHTLVGQWPQEGGYTYYHVRKGVERELPTSVEQDLEAAEQYVWRVRVQYRPKAPARVYGRNLEWQVGQPASFAEEVEAPSAVDYLVSAVAGAVLMGFSQVAAERHLLIDDMELVGSARLENILTHLGVDTEGVPRISSLEGVLYVSSPATRAALDEVWQMTLKRSPLVQTLMPVVTMRLRWMMV
ncbi:sulfurtransferase TusA family protein [Sulfobacillus harzensis]|uniref:sulfurtransferase TusA family protein n=1 Tax=Sulfobacillus harzensis TaxID=2729629 RepID=UPI001A9B24E6